MISILSIGIKLTFFRLTLARRIRLLHANSNICPHRRGGALGQDARPARGGGARREKSLVPRWEQKNVISDPAPLAYLGQSRTRHVRDNSGWKKFWHRLVSLRLYGLTYGDDSRPIKRIMPLSSSCIMNRKGWSATKGAEGAGPD